MISIRQLQPEEYASFESKTFDTYKKLLKDQDEHLIALGAWSNDLPAGLILFQKSKQSGSKEVSLLSIFVSAIFRKIGIGKGLLTAGEDLLREQGFMKVSGQYQREYGMSGVIEKMFIDAGWYCEPHRLLANSFHGVGFLDDPLFKRMHRSMLQDHEVFLWKDRTAAEEKVLKEKITEIPEAYNPFTDFYKDYLRYNSIGLRHEGAIVGWFITLPHHTPNTTHYANMYALPEYAAKGYGIALFYEAVRLERIYLGGNYVQHKGVAHVYYSNPKMVKLTESKLLKYAKGVVHYQMASKKLKP